MRSVSTLKFTPFGSCDNLLRRAPDPFDAGLIVPPVLGIKKLVSEEPRYHREFCVTSAHVLSLSCMSRAISNKQTLILEPTSSRFMRFHGPKSNHDLDMEAGRVFWTSKRRVTYSLRGRSGLLCNCSYSSEHNLC